MVRVHDDCRRHAAEGAATVKSSLTKSALMVQTPVFLL